MKKKFISITEVLIDAPKTKSWSQEVRDDGEFDEEMIRFHGLNMRSRPNGLGLP